MTLAEAGVCGGRGRAGACADHCHALPGAGAFTAVVREPTLPVWRARVACRPTVGTCLSTC